MEDAAKVNKHVLIVDDSKGDALVLSAVCESLSLTFDVAGDGFSAIDRITGGAYSLIILDWQLPYLSGISVLNRIRRMAAASKTPVIMASANKEAHHIEKALRSGASDYLIKPLEREIVVSKIRRFLPADNQKAK